MTIHDEKEKLRKILKVYHKGDKYFIPKSPDYNIIMSPSNHTESKSVHKKKLNKKDTLKVLKDRRYKDTTLSSIKVPDEYIDPRIHNNKHSFRHIGEIELHKNLIKVFQKMYTLKDEDEFINYVNQKFKNIPKHIIVNIMMKDNMKLPLNNNYLVLLKHLMGFEIEDYIIHNDYTPRFTPQEIRRIFETLNHEIQDVSKLCYSIKDLSHHDKMDYFEVFLDFCKVNGDREYLLYDQNEESKGLGYYLLTHIPEDVERYSEILQKYLSKGGTLNIAIYSDNFEEAKRINDRIVNNKDILKTN